MSYAWKPKTQQQEEILRAWQAEFSKQGQTQWWRKPLNVIGKPFELLHKYVEEPGAAILTAPWSPKTPYERQGEGWLERELGEYRAWKAPKFVKGAVEFATTTPLFFLPLAKPIQAIGKGLLGIGGKGAVMGIEPTAKIAEETINKLITAIKGAKTARAETQVLMGAQRIERGTAAAEALAKGEGRKGFEASKQLLAGEMEKARYVPPIKQFTETEVDQLYNVIKNSPKIKGANPALDYYERLNTAKGLDNVLLGGIIPQPHQLNLLENVFGRDLIKAILRKRPLGQKIFQTALDAAGIPRAVLASWDVSGVLRQGAFLFARNPLMGIRSSKSMFKALVRDKNAEMIFENMAKRPFYQKGIEAGLDLTPLPGKIGTPLKIMEEPFMTRLANHIPGVKASNRAYVTVLNEMRSRTWEKIAPVFQKAGATDNDWQQLAKFINYATGRGDFPRQFGQLSPVLNASLFSPRLVFSRFQLPTMLFSSSSLVRKEAMKTFAAMGGFGVGMLSALKLVGAKIELDPRSSDFGKAKIGNTRLDFWAGYSQIARFTAQFLAGERKAVATGRIQDLKRSEVAQLFLQSKMSPAVSLAYDLLRGHTYIGEEMKLDVATVKSQLFQRLAPLFIQDLIDAIQTDGIMGSIKVLPAVAGVGAITYIPGQTPATKELDAKRDEISLQRYGTDWNTLGNSKGKLAQLQLQNESPELQTLLDKVQQERVDRAGVSGTDWSDFYLQRTKTKQDYLSKLKAAQDAYDRGEITGYDFKEIANDAGKALGAIYGHIEKRFPKIMEYYAQPKQVEAENQLAIGDVALEEYMALMFGEGLEDELGRYNAEEAEFRRNMFIANWGQEIYDYVQQTLAAGRTIPPMMRELYKAREILRPYWQIADKVEQMFGKTFAESKAGQRLISKQRKMMRLRNPEMERYYQLFYARAS